MVSLLDMVPGIFNRNHDFQFVEKHWLAYDRDDNFREPFVWYLRPLALGSGRTVQYILSNRQLQAPASGTDKGDHPPITPMKAASKAPMGGQPGEILRVSNVQTAEMV